MLVTCLSSKYQPTNSYPSFSGTGSISKPTFSSYWLITSSLNIPSFNIYVILYFLETTVTLTVVFISLFSSQVIIMFVKPSLKAVTCPFSTFAIFSLSLFQIRLTLASLGDNSYSIVSISPIFNTISLFSTIISFNSVFLLQPTINKHNKTFKNIHNFFI